MTVPNTEKRSDEAVEAAAFAMFGGTREFWTHQDREEWLPVARAALAAADAVDGERIAQAIRTTSLPAEWQEAIRERDAMGQGGEVITIMREWCARIARGEAS